MENNPGFIYLVIYSLPYFSKNSVMLYLFDGLRESGDELIETEQELAVGGGEKEKERLVSFFFKEESRNRKDSSQ